MEQSRDFIDEIKKELNKLAKLIHSEFIDQKELITGLKAKLDEKVYSQDKIDEIKNEIQIQKDKLKKYELEFEEVSKMNTQLTKENEKLERKISGFRKTITIVSNWVEERRESIDVLLALCEDFSNAEDISKETMIPMVVFKNRIIPMLLEKNLIIFDEDSNNLSLK